MAREVPVLVRQARRAASLRRVRTRSAFPAGPGTMPAFLARLAASPGAEDTVEGTARDFGVSRVYYSEVTSRCILVARRSSCHRPNRDRRVPEVICHCTALPDRQITSPRHGSGCRSTTAFCARYQLACL